MPIQGASSQFDYQLPDHLQEGASSAQKETISSAGLDLEQTFPKQEPEAISNQFPEKEDLPVHSLVGSAASQAMEILYSESGHTVLIPQTEPFPMNV